MSKPGGDKYGITDGEHPLVVVVPIFSSKAIVQSTPFVAALNTITVVFEVNYNAGAGSKITVIGVQGSSTGDSQRLSVKSTNDLFGTSGVWNQAFGRLVLTSEAPGLKSATEYTVSFNVTNSATDRPAAAVYMLASLLDDSGNNIGSIANNIGSALTVLTTTQYEVPEGYKPMKVVSPKLSLKRIGQSAPLSNVLNTVTITLKSNTCTVPPGSIMVISGLNGTKTYSKEMTLVPSPNDGSMPTSGFWNQSGTLEIIVASNGLLKDREYTVAFNLTNPGHDNKSPAISIYIQLKSNGVQIGTIPQTAIEPDTTDLLGVHQGRSPLQVQVPRLEVKTIEQNAPFAGIVNTITVSIKANVDMLPGSRVTIHELTGTATGPGTLWIEHGNGGLADTGEWDGYGILTLTSVGTERNGTYEARFNVTNQATSQASPVVMVNASIKSVYGDMSEVMTTAMARNEAELLGVPKGSRPLEVLVPHLEVKTIEQNAPFAGIVNTITVSIKANVDMLPGSNITICGLRGSQSDDGVLGLVLSPSQFRNRSFLPSAVWHRLSGNLTLTSIGTKQRDVHKIVFNVTNDDIDQNSPPVSIRATVVSVFGDLSYTRESLMTKNSSELLGVYRGRDPLTIIRPDFVVENISQSHPLPLSTNRISIRIASNCDFAMGSVVTIAGLVSTLTPDETGKTIYGTYTGTCYENSHSRE